MLVRNGSAAVPLQAVGSKITCTILGHFFEMLNFVPKSPFELPKVAMVPI
jgi:hypothetical protein